MTISPYLSLTLFNILYLQVSTLGTSPDRHTACHHTVLSAPGRVGGTTAAGCSLGVSCVMISEASRPFPGSCQFPHCLISIGPILISSGLKALRGKSVPKLLWWSLVTSWGKGLLLPGSWRSGLPPPDPFNNRGLGRLHPSLRSSQKLASLWQKNVSSHPGLPLPV